MEQEWNENETKSAWQFLDEQKRLLVCKRSKDDVVNRIESI